MLEEDFLEEFKQLISSEPELRCSPLEEKISQLE